MNWLAGHQPITLLMALAFYLAVVVFHDEVTRFAIRFRNNLGVERYNLFFTVISSVTLLFLLTYLIRQIRVKEHKTLKIIYLTTTAGLIVLFYRVALVYNIEAVHFGQYLVLAILLFPLLRSYGETVFWVTFLGVLDELYQYTILTPFFRYFDFNDMLLNLLGAGLGVVIILTTCEVPAKRKAWYRLPAIRFLSIFIPLVVILIFTGIFVIYPDTTGVKGDAFILLNRDVAPSGFWTQAYKGHFYHIVRPGEGVLLMGLLFIFYFLLDPFSQRNSEGSECY